MVELRCSLDGCIMDIPSDSEISIQLLYVASSRFPTVKKKTYSWSSMDHMLMLLVRRYFSPLEWNWAIAAGPPSLSMRVTS